MRKATWTTLGFVVLSVLLCGSGELLAQSDTAVSPADPVERDATDTRVRGTAPGDARVGTPGSTVSAAAQGTGGSGGATTAAAGTGGATGGTGAGSAELRRTVLQLQADMARMSQELAQVRAQLAELNSSVGVGGSGQAVGGSGQAGEQTRAQGTTAPRGNSPRDPEDRGAPDPTTVGRGTLNRTTDPGEAVVNAIYTGTVRSVSARELVLLDEEGQSFTVELGERTRVMRDGKRITARQLQKGTRVRATVDLLAGHNQAMEVIALPSAQ